ncbi:hypothetical protein VKT23_016565 [Stygiomarasmius scandens]|uniref:Uncharacterized protein n=1 Tax=Marasmiellus scandens TaxID=2682957 RepID=A0ABR1IXQ2_9AGAR
MPSSGTKDWFKKLKAPFSRSKNKKNTPNIAITASASVPDFQQANLQLGSSSIGRHLDVGSSLEQVPSAVAGTVVDTQVQDQTQTQSSVPIANVLNTSQIEHGQGTSSAVNVKVTSSTEPSSSGKKETVLKLTDNSLTFLKEFAEFIPVPGIGAALGAVSKCIQTYLVSEIAYVYESNQAKKTICRK